MFLFSKSNRRMEEHGYFIVKILFTEACSIYSGNFPLLPYLVFLTTGCLVFPCSASAGRGLRVPSWGRGSLPMWSPAYGELCGCDIVQDVGVQLLLCWGKFILSTGFFLVSPVHQPSSQKLEWSFCPLLQTLGGNDILNLAMWRPAGPGKRTSGHLVGRVVLVPGISRGSPLLEGIPYGMR